MNTKNSIKVVNGKKVVYLPIQSIQKTSIQKKAIALDAVKKAYEESIRRCPTCGRKFLAKCALIGGHPGFCKKKCFSGLKRKKGIRVQEKNLSSEQKRTARQLRRNEKKKAPPVDFYLSDAWRELRFKILRKYGFVCMACGAKPPDVVLHVDHIKPRINFPDLELDPENLQVLCADCNIGKRHYYQDDLRPK